MKKFIPITLAVIYLLTFSFWSGTENKAEAAYTATLTFANPANGGSVALDANNRFTIDVNVNTASQNSGGADTFTVFDDSKLSFVSGVTGGFYDGNGPAVALDSRASNRVSMGDIVASLSNPANGSGQVGRITFALKSGVTLPTTVTFSIYFTSQGATTDSNVTDSAFPFPDLLAGSSSATITITAYVPPVQSPVITSLNPNNGAAAGNYDVVINGDATRNFGATAGTVRWNGNVISLKSGTSWSATQLTVVAPVGTAGTSVPVTVTNATTTLTSAPVNFTYNAATTHTITGLNPSSGAVAGNYQVIINGTNLDTLTTKTITWGSTSIPSTDPRVTWGASAITLSSIPAGPTAGGTATVTVSGATGTLTFTYNAPGSTAPVISSIVPNSGPEAGSTSVVLTGTNFGSTEGVVTIGGVVVPAADVTPWSSTSITFITPAREVSADTPVNVTITTASDAGSQTSGPVVFTYINATTVVTSDPSISYLSPNSGRADVAVRVTIVGSNFLSTTGTVRFGTMPATVISWSDTQIVVWAPTIGVIQADISYPVTVARTDGKTATASYTYLAPASTGGTPTDGGDTAGTGMPVGVWAGLISANGFLAFLVKRRFF